MRKLLTNLFPYAVAAFPLLFPLYLYRGEAFGLPVTLVEVLLLILVVFFVIREELWKPSFWHQQAHQWPWRPLGLFLVAGALGVLVAPQSVAFLDGTVFEGQMRALGIFKGWIVAPMIYFFVARYTFREKPSLIPVALRALLVGATMLAVQALVQVWTGEFITHDGRASGPFESANYLSLYLGPTVLYGLFASLKKEVEPHERVLLLVLTVVNAAALFFTQSYAAWLALLGAAAVGVLLELRGRSKKLFWGGVMLLLVGALALVLSQLGSDKALQFVEFQERSSTSVRLEVYEIALNLIKDNPLMGIGLGQFEVQYQLNAPEILGHAPFEWIMLHPHNIVLALWLNMGLLGLIALGWLLYKGVAWLAEPNKHERRYAALMLLMVLLHGLFDTPYFKNDLAFQLWLLLAILL